jgi:ATP adenylyltransferase
VVNAKNLKNLLNEVTERAEKSGALCTLPTRLEWVKDKSEEYASLGVTCLVRVIDQFKQRTELHAPFARTLQNIEGKKEKDKERNPFLPYEPELFVMDLGPEHVVILNKYNLVPHHMLMITREFQSQTSPLSLADFAVAAACLAEMAGMVFFNGGHEAGASQKHRHLQMIPEEQSDFPMVELINHRTFPFPHFRWDFAATSDQEARAKEMFEFYSKVLQEHGLLISSTEVRPYNILTTREWMVIIPRERGHYQGVGVNALGYLGSFLAIFPEQLEAIKELGPFHILANC